VKVIRKRGASILAEISRGQRGVVEIEDRRAMTRQWNIDPRQMCRQHLLGEHNELHKALGSIRHGRSVAGWLNRGQIDPITFQARHAQLQMEMFRRGYNHGSPLETNGLVLPIGDIDQRANVLDLTGRCEECRKEVSKARHGSHPEK